MHTVHNINTASMFNCELGEVAEQIKSDNGLGGRSGSHGDFLDELQNRVKESWQNAISEKNMERLRQKVSSLKEYSLDFGIGSQWSNVINSLLYRK